MKRIIGSILICVLVFQSMMNLEIKAEEDISITVNGEKVIFSDEYGHPFIDNNNRTLVPIRIVAESYGANVDWDGETRTVIIEKDGTIVKVPIDTDYVYVNDELKKNDTFAIIKEGRTYLPIRIVLESLGAEVGWDGATRTVIIESPAKHIYFERSDDNHLDWMISIPKGINKKQIQRLGFSRAESKYGNDHYNNAWEERKEEYNVDGELFDAGYIEISVMLVEDDDHGNAMQMDDIFNEDNPFYDKLYLKMTDVMDEAMAYLVEEGYEVYDKVVLEGFSGGAVFAHKFAIVHPERVFAVVAGQAGGYMTLLDTAMGSSVLDWPYGLKNFQANTGKTFNKEAFDDVLKFMYTGNVDNRCSYIGYYDEGIRRKDFFSILMGLGQYDPIRFYNTIKKYEELGYDNYYLAIYEHVIHYKPDDLVHMILKDLKEKGEDIDWSKYITPDEELIRLTTDVDDIMIFKYDGPNEYDERVYDYNFEAKWDLNKKVEFEDENLHNAICQHLGKSKSTQLRYSDVYKIRNLDFFGKDIESLEGIEYLNNLQSLNAGNNKIKDLQPLSELKNIVDLSLGGSPIEEVSYLSSLTKLYHLDLSSTGINNLDFLDKIDNITVLHISGNEISDMDILYKYSNMITLHTEGNPGTVDRSQFRFLADE